MQTVVSYPGIMPHATEVATALAEAGCLARYETTFVSVPGTVLDRILVGILGLVLGKEKARTELERRQVPVELAGRIHRRPLLGLARIGAGRAGLGDLVGDALWEKEMRHFDASVSASLGAGVEAVIGFEHACRQTFRRACRLGLRRIYQMTAPYPRYAEKILRVEEEKFPVLRTAYRRRTEKLAARRYAHKDQEINEADLVIANSQFTANTLLAQGFPASKVRVIPLGAPPVDPSWRDVPREGLVRFLFAGTASVHKGAHYLLDCWRRLGRPQGGELWLAGGWSLPADYARDLPEGVTRLGRLSWPELRQRYRMADILVLPSLGDGFGMVVTEALASGLPVLTTTAVGAADLIVPGGNGLVIPPGNVEALADAMTWCLEHPDELRQMRPQAEAAAARWQWSDYRRQTRSCLGDYFGSRS
jgi:glycosyltransferase involved in cell wall biosynthesis